MDPITTSVVIILGKYVLDKGVELGKEVGPKALDTAKDMLKIVLGRVGLKKPETAAEFPNDPETYQKPLEKILDAEVQADAQFADQLKALLAQYEQAAQEHGASTGSRYQAALVGDGAIAQGPGAVAAGKGGVAVGGNVGGGINVPGNKPTDK